MCHRSPILLGAALLASPMLLLAGDLEDLQAAQQRFENAFETRDVRALAAALDKNYVEFAIGADTAADWAAWGPERRAKYFQDLLAGYESWASRLEPVEYRVDGDTGVVAATERVARVPKGGVLEYPRWRLMATWVKRDGQWRLLSAHRSGMPPVAPDAPPLAAGEGEAAILKAALNGPRWANVPLRDARLIRVLAEAAGARRVVELGTSTGYSGLWIANALRKTGGSLTTFELDPGRAATARRRFEEAGVGGIATVVEGDAHVNIGTLKGPIDLVFIDAEKDGYPDYLRRLLPLVRPGGIVLGHNVRWPAPSQEFIRLITTDPALETIFLNMDDQGVSVTLKKR